MIDVARQPRHGAIRRVVLLSVAGALSLALAPRQAQAHGNIHQELMQRCGGVPAPDCSTYTLPQLNYLGPHGLFAAVEGGQTVMAARPAALKGGRSRHRDPNRDAPPSGPASPAAPQDQGRGNSAKIFKGYALTQLSAAGLL